MNSRSADLSTRGLGRDDGGGWRVALYIGAGGTLISSKRVHGPIHHSAFIIRGVAFGSVRTGMSAVQDRSAPDLNARFESPSNRAGFRNKREIRVHEKQARVPRLSRDSSPRAIEPGSETSARFESTRSKPGFRNYREIRVPEQSSIPRIPGTRSIPRCRRIRREIREAAPHVARHGSQEAPHRGSHDGSLPVPRDGAQRRIETATGRLRARSARHEIGSPAAISSKIAKELASWPFCMQFSAKARREIRNRADIIERQASATRPRFVLALQDEAIKRQAREELALRKSAVKIARP